MRRTATNTLIAAMRHLSRDIQCEDGVATAAIAEAADRIEELDSVRESHLALLGRIAASIVAAKGVGQPTAGHWLEGLLP